MASAITPTSVLRENVGGKNLLIATFGAVIGNGQYWTSGLPSHSAIYGYWTNATTATTSEHGIDVVESSGTFTFYVGESHSGMLYVLTDL